MKRWELELRRPEPLGQDREGRSIGSALSYGEGGGAEADIIYQEAPGRMREPGK